MRRRVRGRHRGAQGPPAPLRLQAVGLPTLCRLHAAGAGPERQLETCTLPFTASFLVESWAEMALTSQDFVVPTVAPSFTLTTSRKTFDVPGATFFRT